MDEDGCGSSGVWHIFSDISLDDVVFQFINGINFKWDYVIWKIISLLVWIGLWKKMIIYSVPPNPVRWSCQGFGFLWQAFMLNWMLWTNNDFKVSHRKQVKATSNMKLVTSLIKFEFRPCGIF